MLIIVAVGLTVEISLAVFIVNVSVCKNYYYAYNIIMYLVTHGSDVCTEV